MDAGYPGCTFLSSVSETPRKMSSPKPLRGLLPLAQDCDWQLKALCRYMDPELFFACDRESRPCRIRRERAAKEICGRCVVQPECRSHAIAAGEAFGVWGGTDETERRFLAGR